MAQVAFVFAHNAEYFGIWGLPREVLERIASYVGSLLDDGICVDSDGVLMKFYKVRMTGYRTRAFALWNPPRKKKEIREPRRKKHCQRSKTSHSSEQHAPNEWDCLQDMRQALPAPGAPEASAVSSLQLT